MVSNGSWVKPHIFSWDIFPIVESYPWMASWSEQAVIIGAILFIFGAAIIFAGLDNGGW